MVSAGCRRRCPVVLRLCPQAGVRGPASARMCQPESKSGPGSAPGPQGGRRRRRAAAAPPRRGATATGVPKRPSHGRGTAAAWRHGRWPGPRGPSTSPTEEEKKSPGVQSLRSKSGVSRRPATLPGPRKIQPFALVLLSTHLLATTSMNSSASAPPLEKSTVATAAATEADVDMEFVRELERQFAAHSLQRSSPERASEGGSPLSA